MTTASENPLERVGRAVADRRVQLGMATQRELAEAAGVALNTAALLERGRSFPHPVNRAKFERALKWPPGTLDALRRGEPAPAGTAGESGEDPGANVQALAVARGVAALAAECRDILLGPQPWDGGRVDAAMARLDGRVLELESVIAATLPHVGRSSFNEAVAALAELRAIRAS